MALCRHGDGGAEGTVAGMAPQAIDLEREIRRDRLMKTPRPLRSLLYSSSQGRGAVDRKPSSRCTAVVADLLSPGKSQ